MIKRLTLLDLSDLMNVEKDCFEDPYQAKQYEYELADNPCAYLYGYYKDDNLIGFIDYWVTFDTTQLCKIGVLEAYRQQQIATELMDFMYEEAIKENCETILLEVRASNQIARSFYEREGFLEINVRKDYYSNPSEDAIVMGKILVGM